ncbi:putative GTP-binding protein EngB [bioreactor metagenome]|jgi:GTP-binding protein|uniref:Putative GTP-binding protein EngB n=1 Tax=bioreactor metagenome TaxID=1076179 RepID=A0A644U3F0_9ZZZZ|nr:YihA family ribosome biogenesis GTP-binding protein [Bacteroidales bacterium]MBP6454774.1 YihA family ribosome biogenesis GTP-binding protein [Bacteroidales bacterium]MBP8677465.1 YihA family ribosome biogenesis GTP-binding protein [Bacteroidales bacterium]MBP9584213.1 YihA family ribosome biogenesis GTP-binding protein [Bacteroidales bacterium]MBP9978841.1 YihA family ribosome biogenesis GTP-binding protein [Bacteroidales bacterium]
MKISKAVFSGSSGRVSEKPSLRLPEFAFIGRSNVGKSSLINALCMQGKLAHTSSTPGKTQLVNHFLINDSWYLVDLPGYGYAKLSKSIRAKLSGIVTNYINESEELRFLFVLLDCRHAIQKIDLSFLIELGKAEVPFAIIYTKADKLGKVALQNRLEENSKVLLEYWEELPMTFASSAESGLGREEILSCIATILDRK